MGPVFTRARGRSRGLGFRPETMEAPVEAGALAAGVEQALLAARPGRVRFRVDVEAQRVAFLAVGRPRLVRGPIGHQDGDLVVVRMDAVFHRARPQEGRGYSR